MSEMSEIYVVSPKNVKILVPKQLCEEFERVVEEETLSEIITEALSDELKRLRFRAALEKARKKVI